MLASLLLWSVAVVSLLLAVLILPVLLFQRFLSVAASLDDDEIEERWAGRFPDSSPLAFDVHAQRRAGA
jgi:hypothetical protein